MASTVLLCALWEILSRKAASPLILPSIPDVMRDLLNLCASPQFPRDALATFARGLIAFGVSFALSLFLGVLSGVFPLFAAVLMPWMSVIKSTPVVAFILIAILWFGSGIVPIFVAVLMTLPVMAEATTQGVRAADTRLLEMAHVYRMSRGSILMNIRIPSAMPFILAGAAASFGLTWKVVIAGEILGFPESGLGSAMQTAKVHLETPRVFSLTIVAILMSVVTEILLRRLARVASRHGRKAQVAQEGATA
jgi:NitT/TauT family transport system permease protein